MGTSSAAPVPCTSRMPTSTPMPGASAQPAEATVNRASPARNTRRGPNRSPATPADSSSAAKASVYPSTAHCSPVTPPPRSRLIAGSARFTAVASRITMK